MDKLKPIPIGIEDFKNIIDKGCYYVDKTEMVKDIIDSGSKVILFTRPRRFGKTLNMSMIQRFFEKTEESNAYLFDNLLISRQNSRYMDYQGQYPVISLSLKSMKQPGFNEAFVLFKKIIADEFERHICDIDKTKLSEATIKEFYNIINKNTDDKSYLYAIRLLSDCLYTSTGKNVIILIDEYDVPLEASHFNGFYEPMVNLIRSVFESALKTNPYLEFGVLTGCLRVSKESIFTGLNNLKVNSICTPDFSNYFGFTEEEVKEVVKAYGIEDRFDEIKEWYDGYLFWKTDIYNPWSVISFISDAIHDSSSLPQLYWSNTSSNDIIHELIVKGNHQTHDLLEQLMNGGVVDKPVYQDITYHNINVNSDYLWSFLLFTGYLKPIETYLNHDNIMCSKMIIPNKEIQTIYKTMIKDWFDEKVRATSRNELIDALVNCDEKFVERQLIQWLKQAISYFDAREMYYHGFVTGLLMGFEDYEIKSNRESGMGRPDILVLEKYYHSTAVIIEIKIADRFRDMDDKCNEALKQIEDREYETELINDCYQKIVKCAIAFYEKTCKVRMMNGII